MPPEDIYPPAAVLWGLDERNDQDFHAITTCLSSQPGMFKKVFQRVYQLACIIQ